ncbi:hypothetical protein [Flavobacterium sp.]|uniref:hypothetical protein n=1 Tax=Flavobacterium sp. TaxID=239 RepID=UPI0040334F56
MEAKEAHKYASWCNANFIKLFPVPTSSPGIYKIAMEKKGIVTQGQQYFRDKPLKNELSVWDKIREIYKEIYEKNNKA